MKQSQKRFFRNGACDCRECTARSYWIWLAPILALAVGVVIMFGVVVFKG